MSAGARFCSSCGKPVVVDARFCPSCGATLAVAPAPPVPSYPAPPGYPAYQPPYQPTPQKSNTKLIIAIVIIVVVAVGSIIGVIAAASFFNTLSTATTWHSGNIVNGLVTVPAGYYEYYQFSVPSGVLNIIVNGTFTASGGSGNDIDVFVMDQTNFVNWQNGHSATTYYHSGQTTTGTVNTDLPAGAGTYYLVYDNSFSTVASKNVQTTVNLYYQG